LYAQTEFATSLGGSLATQTVMTQPKAKQAGERNTPQHSPMSSMQNSLIPGTKPRQVQASVGTIQSLAAVPGSLGFMQGLAGPVAPPHRNPPTKSLGRTQPLRNLQILSSNYQITQNTHGGSLETGNYFLDTDQKPKGKHAGGGGGGGGHQLMRNLSPTVNFQMMQRKDQDEALVGAGDTPFQPDRALHA